VTAPHDDLTPLLGPAALGLLTSVEQQQLDRHLRGCAACRAELAALTGVVRRLADLDDEQALLDDVQPDAARVDAVLAAITAERFVQRRQGQRRQAVLAAAASVVVLAAGLVTAGALSRDIGPAVPLESVAVQAPAGVEASADLVPHTWGVEIKLAATGLATGEPYTVQVRTDDGDLVDAGAFLGTGSRTLFCNLNASVLREDAIGFVVRDAAGSQVLAAEL
jgi:hypothetical protein